jgi:hypothetical protein
MTLSAKTPLALYKANLELVLRLGTLLQENRKRWSEAGAGQANEAIQRTLAQTERLLTANDFTALSSLPGEDFWKSLRDAQAPVQASVEWALSHQAAFAQGLQEAFEAWRQQSADALGAGDAPLPGVNFADFMKPFKPTEPAPAAPRKSGAKAKAKTRTKAKRKPA